MRRVKDFNNGFFNLPSNVQDATYTMSTSVNEQQEDGIKHNFCKQGKEIASCASDTISAAWFDSTPLQRFFVYYARIPDKTGDKHNCAWEFQFRFDTEPGTDPTDNTTHYNHFMDLYKKSETCLGVKPGEEKTFAPTMPTAAPTSAAPTTGAPVACVDHDDKVTGGLKTCVDAYNKVVEQQGADGACASDMGYGVLNDICCKTCTTPPTPGGAPTAAAPTAATAAAAPTAASSTTPAAAPTAVRTGGGLVDGANNLQFGLAATLVSFFVHAVIR